MIGLTAARAEKLIAEGGAYFDATKGVRYGGPDAGFVKFAGTAGATQEPLEGDGSGSVCCEPDAGWMKSDERPAFAPEGGSYGTASAVA
jgi:hypothetical protein